jgi:hypothetical protein
LGLRLRFRERRSQLQLGLPYLVSLRNFCHHSVNCLFLSMSHFVSGEGKRPGGWASRRASFECLAGGIWRPAAGRRDDVAVPIVSCLRLGFPEWRSPLGLRISSASAISATTPFLAFLALSHWRRGEAGRQALSSWPLGTVPLTAGRRLRLRLRMRVCRCCKREAEEI